MDNEMRMDTRIDNFSYQNKIENLISEIILVVIGIEETNQKRKIFLDRIGVSYDWFVPQ
jgi:hypothetical protein